MEKIAISTCFGTVVLSLCLTSEGNLALLARIGFGTDQIIGQMPVKSTELCIADLRTLLRRASVTVTEKSRNGSRTLVILVEGDVRLTDIAVKIHPTFRFEHIVKELPVRYGALGKDEFVRDLRTLPAGAIRRILDRQECAQGPSGLRLSSGTTDMVAYLERRTPGIAARLLSDFEEGDEYA